MNIRESSYGYWTSSRSFLWVAAGATVGIGNASRLPYLMGEHGGAVFLGFYVLCLLLVGSAAAGYRMGAGTLDARRRHQRLPPRASTPAGASRLLGGDRLPVAGQRGDGAVLLQRDCRLEPGLRGTRGRRRVRRHRRRAGAPGLSSVSPRIRSAALSWHTIFMVTACIIVTHGFRDGVERAALRLLPALPDGDRPLRLRDDDRQHGGGAEVPADTGLAASSAGAVRWRALQQAPSRMALGIGSMLALGSVPAGAGAGERARPWAWC